MEKLGFSLEYDDQLDDAVEKISAVLNKVGYDIDFNEEMPERDDGVVDYVITECPKRLID